MNDKPEEMRDDEAPHVHRWSFLKDRDFYEQGDLIARYFNLASRASDCPHTDSPIVDTIETVAYVYWNATPLPNNPMLRTVFMEMLQAMGNSAFVAGMRFALDGNRLDSTKFMDGDVNDQPEDMGWDDDRAEAVHEWRENVRKKFYVPEKQELPAELKAALEKFMGQKIPDGARVVDTGDGSFGLGIPVMRQSEDNDEFRPGTYL